MAFLKGSDTNTQLEQYLNRIALQKKDLLQAVTHMQNDLTDYKESISQLEQEKRCCDDRIASLHNQEKEMYKIMQALEFGHLALLDSVKSTFQQIRDAIERVDTDLKSSSTLQSTSADFNVGKIYSDIGVDHGGHCHRSQARCSSRSDFPTTSLSHHGQKKAGADSIVSASTNRNGHRRDLSFDSRMLSRGQQEGKNGASQVINRIPPRDI